MDGKDYNIDINIQAKYNQVEQLNKVLEQTKKQLSGMSKARINFDTKKIIQNSAEPIKVASDMLNKAIASYNKAGTVNLQEKRGQELKDLIKTIEHSKVLKNVITEINAEYNKQKQTRDAYTSARDSLNKFMLSLDPTRQKLEELKEKMQAAQEEFIKLDMASQNTNNAKRNIAKLAKEMQTLQESSKKSSGWVGKLMGRIRNIAIYRGIRTALRWFTSGVNEGLQGLAQYSGDVNSTMSNINNSLNQVRNTLAVSFASVLQSLEPIITKVSDILVDLINSFNLAMAKMQGKNVYTKAKKATDDYAKSAEKARKLSFDTFEVLSGGDDKTPIKDLFEEGNVNEETTKLSETLFTVLGVIKNIAGVVGRLINQIMDSGMLDNLMNIIGDIVIAIGQIISELLTSGAMNVILDVIGEIANVAGVILRVIAQIIGKLAEMGALKPMIYGLIAAWAAYKAIMIGVTIATWAKTSADIAAKSVATWGAFAAAGAAIVGASIGATAAIISKVNGYETGGIPNKSELFYMNENGVPEALVNTGGAQTNVINIDQLSEGMRRGFIQAIYDTDLLGAIREQGGTTLMVDKDVLGSTVASSAGFRNEVNRRNTNLNLR